MCLTRLTTREHLVAKSDIVCYKVLAKCKSARHKGKYMSPYMHFFYTIGEQYDGTLCKIGNTVEMGFHVFVKKSDAINIDKGTSSVFERCVVRCIIPKGSAYYRGKFHSPVGLISSLASKNIKIEKIVYSSSTYIKQ